MPNERFQKLSPTRQESILAAAADEFAQHGYGAASMNRIVERAGSSKGALYYYFDSKADLLATVVERAATRVMAELEWPELNALSADSYWQCVRDVTLRTLELMRQDTWYMRVLWSFYRLREEPAARAATAGVLEQSRTLTRVFLERGRELGVVRTDVPLELLVEMQLAADEAGDRWLIKHWDSLSDEEKHTLLEKRAELVRDMLDARHMGWDK
jgi:AcrR family transcriptional regulator